MGLLVATVLAGRFSMLAGLLVAQLFLLSNATAVSAAALFVSIEGHVTGFDPGLGLFFAIGDPISITFEVDTSVADTGGEAANYPNWLQNFSMSIGNELVMPTISSSHIQIGNDITVAPGVQADRISSTATLALSLDQSIDGQIGLTHFQFGLEVPINTFDTESIYEFVRIQDLLVGETIFLRFNAFLGGALNLYATPDSVVVTPEPGKALLTLIGLLLGQAVRRKRRA